jgi:nucleoporin SEH1
VPPGTSAGGTEVVLCADFDRYGTRLVTGGADHRLRMYERVDDCWELVDMWRGHNGMVLDVWKLFIMSTPFSVS